MPSCLQLNIGSGKVVLGQKPVTISNSMYLLTAKFSLCVVVFVSLRQAAQFCMRRRLWLRSLTVKSSPRQQIVHREIHQSNLQIQLLPAPSN